MSIDPDDIKTGMIIRIAQSHCDSCECARNARITKGPYQYKSYNLVDVEYIGINGDIIDTDGGIDVDSIVEAKPRKLLTWSEPDANGDIRAGGFLIEKSKHWQSREDLYTALVDDAHTSVGRFSTYDTAKLACEIHARKMLGWY